MPGVNDEPHLDILRNIEFAIVRACSGACAGNTDYEVSRGLDALLDDFRSLSRGRPPRPHMLDAGEKAVYDAVKAVCDWRMGQGPFPMPQAGEQDAPGDTAAVDTPAPISAGDMAGCLKKIRKSVDRWNGVGGRRGYLDFIRPFLP